MVMLRSEHEQHPPFQGIFMRHPLSLIAAITLLASLPAHAEKIRYICSGTDVEYDGWSKRVEQMSSLKEDPIDLLVDTEARKVSFSTRYTGPIVAELKESAQWYEGDVEINKVVMNGKIASVRVKVNRVYWGASTIYTMDNGDNHLGYAGVCTPKRID
jgi:hypothetical protein